MKKTGIISAAMIIGTVLLFIAVGLLALGEFGRLADTVPYFNGNELGNR